MDIITIALLFALSYLIGSLPIGYAIGRLNGVDIFKTGSGNMGANNIARHLGKFWGIVTWFSDSAKGIVAILIARSLVPTEFHNIATIVGGVGAIVGHTWSIAVMFITGRLRGGKGASTAIGTWLTFIPPVVLAVIMSIWALIILTTRYVSLAVLVATALIGLTIIVLVLQQSFEPVYLLYLIVPVIIFYRHRENILALSEGRERKLGQRV